MEPAAWLMTRVGSNKSVCFVWRMLERLCESNVHLLCATEENASLNTSTCLYFLSPTTHFFHLVFFSPLFLITLVKKPFTVDTRHHFWCSHLFCFNFPRVCYSSENSEWGRLQRTLIAWPQHCSICRSTWENPLRVEASTISILARPLTLVLLRNVRADS